MDKARGWRVFVAVFIAAGVISAAPAGTPSEYEVKAAFLYNFAKFVEWPSKAFKNESDPMIIGVLGEDPFGSILDDTVKDKTAAGRKLVVKRFKKAGDIDTCHILFISSSEKERIAKILENLRGNVLTVGEIKDFARKGGVIEFVMDEKKVGFIVNLKAAKKADLQISSKLLKLAKSIIR